MSRSLKEIVELSLDYILKKGGRPRHEVEEWIAHTLGMRRLDLYLQFDRPVESDELDQLRAGVSRLAEGEPLAYICGKAPFYGYEFIVSPEVLIPRPETELLVDTLVPFLEKSSGTFVDVCTGSGCIGLTVKKKFPEWKVVLTDISKSALKVAKKNAEQLCVDVEILHGDLLSSFLPQKAECIVCNPPYLSKGEWEELEKSVQDFEPRGALEAGPSGVEMYERLLPQMKEVLVPKGLGVFEIGALQRDRVVQLVKGRGFDNIECIQDLSGLDRIVSFEQN